MEKTFKFTRANIRRLSLEDGKKQTLYWNTEPKGLGIRVTKSKQVFIYEQRLHGNTIRLSLPNVQELEEAEVWARKNSVEIGDKKIDPRETAKQDAIKRAEKTAQAVAKADRDKILVSQAWDDYIAYQKSKMNNSESEIKTKKKGKVWGERHLLDHIHAAQKGGEKYKRGDKLTADGVLYPLLQFKLAEINSTILMEWLAEENNKPKARHTVVRNGFEKFRTFWNWCAKTKPYDVIIDKEALRDELLVERVPDRPDDKLTEEDVLQRANIADWFREVQNIPNPVISAYLQCLLITGARRNELAALKWTDINYKAKTLWVKDKVTNKGRHIPLHLFMDGLIAPLPRINKYVFSSPTSEAGYLIEPADQHNQALERAGIPHLSIHGLRRSFASLWIWTQPDGAGGRIQGHTPKTVRDKYYLKLPVELIAQWHDGYMGWLLNEAGIPKPE